MGQFRNNLLDLKISSMCPFIYFENVNVPPPLAFHPNVNRKSSHLTSCDKKTDPVCQKGPLAHSSHQKKPFIFHRCRKVRDMYVLWPDQLPILLIFHNDARFNYVHYDKIHGAIYKSIEALDRMGMEIIETGDPDAFKKYLKEFDNTICGRHPISVFLHVSVLFFSEFTKMV